MLTNRIARFASRHGLTLPADVGPVRVGLVGSVRIVEPIPVALSNSVCAKAGISAPFIETLNHGDLWARIEFATPNPAAIETFAAGGPMPPKASLVLVTEEAFLRFVPADGCLLLVDLIREVRQRPPMHLAAQFSAGHRVSFDAAALFRALHAQAQIRKQLPLLAHADRKVQEYLIAHRRYLETVREHLGKTTPEAAFEIVSQEPLSLACPTGRWPKAFARERARLWLTDTTDSREALSVDSVDDNDVLWLQHADPEGKLPHHGMARLDPSAAIAPLRRMLEALGALAQGSHVSHLALMEALCQPESLPDFTPQAFEPRWLGPRDHENADQHDAVSAALGCPDVCTIHGPPGTGKTRVICELITQLVARDQRILLVAPTHVALDNVLERIGKAPGVVAIRLGTKEVVDPRAHDYLLPSRARTLGEHLIRGLDAALSGAPSADPVVAVQRELREAVERTPEAIGAMLLLNANLVCATPVGIAMVPEFNTPEPVFDVLIMDEASKATLTEFLVPATRANRWIIVGDHLQLPPYEDADELAAVVQERAPTSYLGEPPAGWASDIATALRRQFDQRLHPDKSVRDRAWSAFLSEVTGDDLQQLGLPPRIGAWRDLAAAQVSPGYTGGDPRRLPHLARLVADLLQAQQVSMPSIFEHLLDLPATRAVRLTTQRRMAPSLAAFSREAVYQGKYESAESTRLLGLGIPMLEEDSIWIDTRYANPADRYEWPRDQDWRGGSYENRLEIAIVDEIVGKLIEWAKHSWRAEADGEPLPFEIGIVSFYGRQSERLCDKILGPPRDNETRWRRPARVRAANGAPIDLHVSIVDRFQGQEKDVIILSGTRSNPEAIRGHVNNINRLNVAVTRARHKRILVGDGATLVDRRKGGARPPDDLLSRLFQTCTVKSKWGRTLGGGKP